jgi:hypothetical protein
MNPAPPVTSTRTMAVSWTASAAARATALGARTFPAFYRRLPARALGHPRSRSGEPDSWPRRIELWTDSDEICISDLLAALFLLLIGDSDDVPPTCFTFISNREDANQAS